MDVKCPQCGRIYDLPDTKVSRSLKCICKFTFRYDSHSSAKSSPEEAPSKAAVEFSDTTNDEHNIDLSGNMSEGEIDNFLSSLRQSQKEIKNQEKELEDTASIVTPNFNTEIELNLGDNPSSTAETLFEETSESRFQAPVETVAPAENFARKTTPPVVRPRLSEQLINFLSSRVGILSLISTGLVALVTLSLYFVFSSGENEKTVDPFLSELLESEEQVLPQLATSEKKVIAEAPKEGKPKIAASKKKSDARPQSVPLNLEVLSKEASYEKIWPDSNPIGNENQALYYEAGLLLKSASASQKNSISQQIREKISSSGNSVFNRAEAVALIANNQSSDAVKRLKNLQLTRSRDAFVFAYLGLAYEKLNRPQLSLSAYSQAITIDSQFPWALLHAIRMANASGQQNIALDLSEKLISLDSSLKSAAYTERAKIYSQLKQISRAESDLNAAVKLQDSFDSRILLGQMSLSRRPALAEKHFLKATQLASTSTEKRNALYGLGQAYCQNKSYDQASGAFYQAYQEDRNFIAALEEKARCEMKMGNPNKAARTLQSILKTRPQDHSIWLAYGNSLRFTKKYKPAIAAVKRSLELKDTDAGHYELALIYMSMNRKSEAAYHAKRAYRMNPKNTQAQKLLGSLK